MKNVKEIIKDWARYLKSKNEKRESKNQMEKDLKRFRKEFEKLDATDQQKMEEVAEFRLENTSSININIDDKKKEWTIRKMVDILTALPRHKFYIVYSLLKEKTEKQESLSWVLSADIQQKHTPKELHEEESDEVIDTIPSEK